MFDSIIFVCFYCLLLCCLLLLLACDLHFVGGAKRVKRRGDVRRWSRAEGHVATAPWGLGFCLLFNFCVNWARVSLGSRLMGVLIGF